MLIGSPIYCALIIPLALLVFYLPAGNRRAVFLLLVSWAYYLTFPPSFFLALLYVIVVAYGGALLIERWESKTWCWWLVTAILVLCAAPLLLLKYIVPQILHASAGTGANWDLLASQLIFPVGLSFYTFAALGYLIDVALGVIPAERNFTRVGLLCAFFPVVTAGPIPRAATLFPQLDFARKFESERAMRGVTEILIGALMKFAFADALSGPASAVYGDLANMRPLEIFAGTVFFGYYLYADFAGYSLIAIGSARLLGIDLPDNFRQPFLASSVPEFWRSWHISLLTWLRDYVFTPLRLQLRDYPRLGTYAATFLTLVLVGIWHGAGWGFVAFGAVHGVLMIFSQWTQPSRDRLWQRTGVPAGGVKIFRILITFVIICLTLVLLRSKGLAEALQVYGKLFSWNTVRDLWALLPFSGAPAPVFQHITFQGQGLALVLLALLVAGDIVARNVKTPVFKWRYPVRAVVYAACMLTILFQAVSTLTVSPYAYFQF